MFADLDGNENPVEAISVPFSEEAIRSVTCKETDDIDLWLTRKNLPGLWWMLRTDVLAWLMMSVITPSRKGYLVNLGQQIFLAYQQT